MNRYFLIRTIFIVYVMVIAAACTQHGTSSSDNEAGLKQRVQALWDAKAGKNWGAVYDMATDSYKKTINRNDFIQRANIQIESFEIKEIGITVPKKEGKALIAYTLNQMDFKFNTTAKEKWIWENNNWHLYMPPDTIKR